MSIPRIRDLASLQNWDNGLEKTDSWSIADKWGGGGVSMLEKCLTTIMIAIHRAHMGRHETHLLQTNDLAQNSIQASSLVLWFELF